MGGVVKKTWWTEELSHLWNLLQLSENSMDKSDRPRKLYSLLGNRSLTELSNQLTDRIGIANKKNFSSKTCHKPKDFWHNMGNVGVAQERLKSITMVVVNHGQISSNIDDVLLRRKSDFEQLSNG